MAGAAISLSTGDERQEPVFATDHVAGELDELQFRLGEGASVEAFARCRPVQITGLADVDDARWSMFALAARQTPARGMSVFPLHAGTIGIGVLALYHVEPGVLPTSDMAAALCAADAAFWALLRLLPATTPERGKAKTMAARRDWLAGAPLHRTEVYQATGMIIAQLNVSAESALARLRAHAFVHGPSLAEVARDVVTVACGSTGRRNDRWSSRVIIEQVRGVSAERGGLDMADAFAALRSYARRTNR